MYIPERNLIVLDIPNRATDQLRWFIREKLALGEIVEPIERHKTLVQLSVDLYRLSNYRSLSELPPFTVVAVVDDPVNWFVSQVNRLAGQYLDVTLDQVMAKAWWSFGSTDFLPQWAYTHVPIGGESKPLLEVDLRLWDNRRVKKAASYILGKPCIEEIDASKRTSRFTGDEVMDHPTFIELMESEAHYKPDYALYLEALRTDNEGRKK